MALDELRGLLGGQFLRGLAFGVAEHDETVGDLVFEVVLLPGDELTDAVDHLDVHVPPPFVAVPPARPAPRPSCGRRAPPRPRRRARRTRPACCASGSGRASSTP